MSLRITHVKDTKVVKFKRKFYYIIPVREFFTTSKEKKKKKKRKLEKMDKIRIES